MICERCKKRDSTVHLTEIIKSVRSEVHLCEQCARDIGFNAKLSNYSLSIPDMLSFLDDDMAENDTGVCPCCGSTAAGFGMTVADRRESNAGAATPRRGCPVSAAGGVNGSES